MRRHLAFGCRRPARTAQRRARVVLPIESRLEIVEAGAGVQTARFTIGRELKSQSFLQYDKVRIIQDRREWTRAIASAIEVHHTVTTGQALSVLDRQYLENRAQPTIASTGTTIMRRPRKAPKIKSRVVITRIVPSKRNFLLDDDNLIGGAKQLTDVLKKLALIYEDRRTWCDRPMPEQRVSAAGLYQTVIEVTPWLPLQLPGRNHVER